MGQYSAQYPIILLAGSKGPYQTAHMHRLIWVSLLPPIDDKGPLPTLDLL